MCFSATASFSAAAVLVPAGAYCVFNAARNDRSLLPLAATPIFFALQQATEGFVWMGIHHGDEHLIRTASQAFLFFAVCFWLWWIPLCVFVVERHRPVRNVLLVTLIIGVAYGLLLFMPSLLHPEQVTARVMKQSLDYDFPSSSLIDALPTIVWQALYVAIIAVPQFLLGSKRLRIFGLLFVASAVVTQLIYAYAFTSVWCFFASLMSVYLCVIIPRTKTPSQTRRARAVDADVLVDSMGS